MRFNLKYLDRIYAMIHACNNANECKLKEKFKLYIFAMSKHIIVTSNASLYNFYNDVIDECNLMG